MTQAKLEPGEHRITLGAGKDEQATAKRKQKGKEHDLLPELGLERPTKSKEDVERASPLDDATSLGD